MIFAFYLLYYILYIKYAKQFFIQLKEKYYLYMLFFNNINDLISLF